MAIAKRSEFFVKRTDPFPGESLVSLVHRLTVLNRYEDESWILRLIEPDRRRIQKFDLNIHTNTSQLRLLAVRSRTPYVRMYEMTAHRFSHQFLPEQDLEADGEGHGFVKDIRRAKYIGVSQAKFCPVCLQEERYHRIYWDLLYVTTCLEHRVVLNDRCSSCGKRVTGLEVSRGFHSCGSDLRKETGIDIGENNIFIETQRHIQALLGVSGSASTRTDPVLFLPSVLFFNLLDAAVPVLLTNATPPHDPWLGSFEFLSLPQSRTRATNWRHFPNTVFHVLLANAFRLFLNWPLNFYGFLSRCRDRGGDRGFASLIGPYRSLRRLFDAISREDHLSFITEAFDYFISRGPMLVRKNSRFFAQRARARQWVNLTEAANILGISRNVVTTLCKSNLLDNRVKDGRMHVGMRAVMDLQRRLETCLSIEKVAERLGVQRSEVVDLINAGYLTEDKVTAKSRFIRIEDVTRFEKGFLNGKRAGGRKNHP